MQYLNLKRSFNILYMKEFARITNILECKQQNGMYKWNVEKKSQN